MITRVREVVSRMTTELQSQRGSSGMQPLIFGVIFLVVGLVLSAVIIDQAASSGTNANIGSFSGAQALNDLVPLLYYAAIVVAAVGLMALGGVALKRKYGS